MKKISDEKAFRLNNKYAMAVFKHAKQDVKEIQLLFKSSCNLSREANAADN